MTARRLPSFPGCGIGDEAAAALPAQIECHRRLGWSAIELRTVDGVALAALPPAEAGAVVRQVREAGLEVPVLDAAIGNWNTTVGEPFERDVEELEALARLARELGSRGIRVMSYPNDGRPEADWRAEVVRRLGELARRAESHGLLLLHENCHGWAGTSAERTLDLVEAAGTPALRVLFDVGNPVAHGYDGHEYLSAVLPLVEHVHVKDAVRTGPGPDDVDFVPPGEGDARLLDCLALLAESGFSGGVSIEPHVAYVFHRGQPPGDELLSASYVDYARRFEELLAGQAGASPAVASRSSSSNSASISATER